VSAGYRYAILRRCRSLRLLFPILVPLISPAGFGENPVILGDAEFLGIVNRSFEMVCPDLIPLDELCPPAGNAPRIGDVGKHRDAVPGVLVKPRTDPSFENQRH